MKIDNIDNIANKEKSPDKAERSASIDDIKKTQKFFDFNDLSSNAAAINNNKNLIIPESDSHLYDYISPENSKLKKLLLNSDPEVANLNINNEKVHNNSEFVNNNNSNSNNVSGSSFNDLPQDSINNNSSATSKNSNISSNSLLKSKSFENSTSTNAVVPNATTSNADGCNDRKITRNKPKVFWCSECNEYFLKLNLFNHMKSVHNKFTCLYCYGFFVKIEGLEKHLVKKHKVQNTFFSDEQSLRSHFEVKKQTEQSSKVIKAVCCQCGSIFLITDFISHSCSGGGKEKFLAINEAVPSNIFTSEENSFTDLAVHKNCNDAFASVNQLNTTKEDESQYCEKAIQQWLQPNKSFNGAPPIISNKASSQNVPDDENEKPSWHVEEEKLSNNSNTENKLTVPKLTLKIPKGFQNQTFDNIDSDEDSGDEEEDEDSISEHDKSKSFDQNMSNSINEYSSSLSDSDNENSSSNNNLDNSTSNKKDTELPQKRPENLPCLKLKIKNLTSNPETVLENYDFTSTAEKRDVEQNEGENETIKPQNHNDVDMSECPMDIEPTVENTSLTNQQQPPLDEEVKEPEPKKIIIDGVVITPANEDILPIDIRLDESLDRIDILKLMKICLRASFQYCLYCNHARKIVVNGKGIAQHFITHHRFHAFVDSITAEELHPEKFVSKFESSIEELSTCFFNLDTYDDHDEEKKEGHVTISHDKLYECFQCRFQTPIHKELYLHNRKMHQKSLINCLMCKTGFYSYSELLCHICPGIANKQTFNDYKFYCCLCNMDNIPSAFRLMVHLRKKHYACDVCLEKCSDQGKLSSHVWKHKLLHICYRCHIFYQNKADIMKHLFWKHGTEGIECKKCLQKKWPHVYHFCIPPATFSCPHCEMTFSKAMALKVHVRLHEDGAKYACTEIGCEKKFISKKLLIRHLERHQSELAAQENGNQGRTEATVIIPHEIPDGCCTRTIPVVFKRFIKKPAVRKIEIEPKVEPPKVVEPEPKKEEGIESKSILDLPESNNLNLSESSESDSSSSDENDDHTVPDTQKTLVNEDKPVSDQVKSETADESMSVNKPSSAAIENEKMQDEMIKVPLTKVSTLSDSDDDDEMLEKTKEIKEELKESTVEPMKNILENLKNFQEQQQQIDVKAETNTPDTEKNAEDSKYKELIPPSKTEKMEEDIPDKLPEKVVLHVCMSDHDYAKLYRVGTTTDDLENVIQSATIDKDKNKTKLDKDEKSKATTGKKSKGDKTEHKKNDDFSSSDSSSGSSSDSSNSSSSGSSSSSDSSTSDSSSSEASSTNTNRLRNKKYTKKRSKKDNKKNEPEPEEPEVPRDPDEIIYESDLLTDETDTDEDFYDEHPLKLNNQALAEKRKQLGDIDGIIENSRPSTPSLPPDEKVEKRIKVKRRKRDHKKSMSSPNKRANREQSSFVNADDESTSFSTIYQPNNTAQNLPETPQNLKFNKFMTSTPISAPPRIELHQANQIRQLLQSTQQQPVLPILKEQHSFQNQNEYISVSRVSSAQSSRMNSDNEQSSVKRSQRRRIPNKFYGYTSDDDRMGTQMSTNDPFKPIPPPNLTWNKEDLPSRSKSPPLSTQQPQIAQPLPPQQRIAPLKLNLNSNDLQHQPPNFEASSMPQQVQPVNNLYSMNMNTNSINNSTVNESSGFNYSDSESSNDQLHISEPKKRKRKQPSQNMYAFHTLETPPTVQPNQPPIPRLKLTIGSNNKIRRRNINPLKPPPKKRRKGPAPAKTSSNLSATDISMTSNASTLLNNSAYTTDVNRQLSSSSFEPNQPKEKFSKQMLAQEKKQRLEEAIMNTQQYFQRYNHTQVASTDKPQEQAETDDRVYCYCRRPYDDLQGMIGCDGPNCQIEWFHFECVGILVPPKGNWFCPECQKETSQAF